MNWPDLPVQNQWIDSSLVSLSSPFFSGTGKSVRLKYIPNSKVSWNCVTFKLLSQHNQELRPFMSHISIIANFCCIKMTLKNGSSGLLGFDFNQRSPSRLNWKYSYFQLCWKVASEPVASRSWFLRLFCASVRLLHFEWNLLIACTISVGKSQWAVPSGFLTGTEEVGGTYSPVFVQQILLFMELVSIAIANGGGLSGSRVLRSFLAYLEGSHLSVHPFS